MSDAKHTPGEWYAIGGKVYVDVGGRACVIAQANHWPGQTSHNAHLIAASPELLAACEAWDTGFVDGEQFDAEQFRVWVNERRAMARAAIAKAKGGAA